MLSQHVVNKFVVTFRRIVLSPSLGALNLIDVDAAWYVWYLPCNNQLARSVRNMHYKYFHRSDKETKEGT